MGIMSMLNRQDKAAFFSTIRKNKANPGQKRGPVSHIFVSGIEAVLNDSTRMGPLSWLTDNPGRQLLTGSFHPGTHHAQSQDAVALHSYSPNYITF
jgi:hypothetical protein